jgi:hypothetical protein
MSTYCIYVPSLVRIDWKMTPQLSRMHNLVLFLWCLRHAAPRHATWPQVRQILLGSKCQHTASIYRVWWELIKKWHHSCQECTIWSFFMFFAPRCAKPRHATWPQVRQILLGSKCQHTASIYRVWWESIEKWHHSGQECTIWSFFMVFAPRCATPRHTTWPQVRQILLGSKY